MNKKLISVLTVGVLAGSLTVGCSSNNTTTDSNNTKIERSNKDELKEKLEIFENAYVSHYNSLGNLEVTTKIDLQNDLNNSINTLDDMQHQAYKYACNFKSDTDERKACEAIQFALYELKEAEECAIKYLDTGDYNDFKEYTEKLQMSFDSYTDYTAYKDQFGVEVYVKIGDNRKDKEEAKENIEKGGDESDNTTRNKTTDETETEKVTPKTTTNTNKSTKKSNTTKNRTETTETEKVTHDCWRCGKKNVTNYDEHWLCDDCYLEKIAHEEVDEEEVPTGHDCAICGQKNVPNYDDAHGWLCDNCYLGANQVDDYVED